MLKIVIAKLILKTYAVGISKKERWRAHSFGGEFME
jgi:hypothetical protein